MYGNINKEWEWEKAIKDILISIPEYDIEPIENLESLQSTQRTTNERFASLTAIVKEVWESETNYQ